MSTRRTPAGWFRRQYGLITRDQAMGAGCTRGSIQHFLASGQWERVSAGVFRHGAVRPSFEQSCLAAVLTAGPTAVVSHWSAARLFKVAAKRQAPVSISMPNGT